MKRFLCFCMGVGLACTVILPLHLMAGSLVIQTSDGYNILINKPLDGIFVDGAGNVAAELRATKTELQQSANFFNYEPLISIEGFSGGTGDDSTGIVNAAQFQRLSFNVKATDSEQKSPSCPNSTLVINSLALPLGATFTRNQSDASQGVFEFTPTADQKGTFLAIFSAIFDCDGAPGGANPTTQRVVKIAISEPTPTLTVTAANGTVSATVNNVAAALPWTGPAGTSVVLTATPNAGYTFAGWSGDASGTANPVTVVMNGNKNVIANFVAIQYTLNVTVSGTGSVTKSPDQSTYAYGQQVQLTAVPGNGYNFTGWSGDCSGTTSPYTLTMNSNKNVTATFTLIPACTATVTAIVSGSGGALGAGQSNPVSVACGGAVNFSGTITTSGATATVSEGNYYSGNGLNWSWTGITAPTTTGANKNVTITFTPPQTCTSYVQLSRTNTGGTITSSNPAVATCGSTVSFLGTFGSGYSGGSATEGTFTASGTSWSLGNISAPTTNGQTKTVSITFTGSTPPPSACSTGIDMSDDVARAVALNQEIRGGSGGYIGKFGFENPSIYSNTNFYFMPARTIVVFLADPAGFRLEPAAVPSDIGISVMDYSQTAYGQLSVQVKRLDRSNCYIKNVGMLGFNNQYANFYDTGYSAGNKFLIYVSAPAVMNVAVRWGF